MTEHGNDEMAGIDYEQLYREVIPSVVSLYVGRADGPTRGSGSGFVFDESHVLTNAHVVGVASGAPETPRENGDGTGGDAARVDLRFSDGAWAEGDVVGVDEYTDLAVVRVTDLPASAVPLDVAAENPAPGRRVAALGNPMGLDGSISAGIVSGANRSMPTTGGFAIPDVVQTDAPINPGNSGGPLVAPVGDGYEVVGVNRARQGDNIGFAVSPAIVSRVVPVLVEEGEYTHSYLRSRTLDVTPTLAAANGLAEPRGVLVVDTADSHSDADDGLRGCVDAVERNGLRVPVGGDVVVGIGDNDVDSHEQLMRYLITETTPGEPVSVRVLREGVEERLELRLSERPGPPGGDRAETNEDENGRRRGQKRRRGRRGRFRDIPID